MAEAENIMVWQWQRLAEAEVKKPHLINSGQKFKIWCEREVILKSSLQTM